MDQPADMQSVGTLKTFYDKEADAVNNKTPLSQALERRRKKLKEKVEQMMEEKQNGAV